jgi:DNA replication protein DnaC
VIETTAYIVERLHAMDVRLVITTNYAPRELAERLGQEDRVVGERVVDRLLEDALRIRLDRPSLRTPRHDHRPEEEAPEP